MNKYEDKLSKSSHASKKEMHLMSDGFEFKISDHIASEEEISKILLESEGYTPYFDQKSQEVLELKAYVNSKFAGLISVLRDEIEYPNSDNTLEITAYTLKKFRNKGIYTALRGAIIDKINDEYYLEDMPKFLAQPSKQGPSLQTSSLLKAFAYNELMMALNFEDIAESIYKASNSPAESALKAQVQALCRFDGKETYIIEADDKEIGHIGLSFNPNRTFIYDVYIDEEMRGKRLGSLMVSEFIKAYFKAYKSPLYLQVSEKNTAALKLYENCGFKTIEKAPYYFV